MIFQQNDFEDIPRNKFDIDTNAHLESLLGFFEDQILEFVENKKKVLDEESINEELIIFLNRECINNFLPFFFHSEPRSKSFVGTEGKSPSVDLGIILAKRNADKKSIFDIEAKRLRKPPSLSKQYVKGKTGGIERFKRELHGENLEESAVVGYVEDATFGFWISKINGWIKDLAKNNSDDTITWKKSEVLEKHYFKSKNARCKSENIRSDSIITLHHFWVKINTN